MSDHMASCTKPKEVDCDCTSSDEPKTPDKYALRDAARDVLVAAATRPRAVDVAKVAAPLLAISMQDPDIRKKMVESAGYAGKIARECADAALDLILQAQRQLDQEREAQAKDG